MAKSSKEPKLSSKKEHQVEIPPSLTVGQLADLLAIKGAEVVKQLAQNGEVIGLTPLLQDVMEEAKTPTVD